MFLLYCFLLLIFIFEALGLPKGHEIAYFITIVCPLFLFWQHSEKKIILAPKKFILFTSIFILALIVSTVFSMNMANSVGKIFLYPSLFLIALYVFNHRGEFAKSIVSFISLISFLLLSLSLIGLIFPVSILKINPLAGYSLLYHPGNFHNNLGDFLSLVLIISLYRFIKHQSRRVDLAIFVSTVPFFLFSFSRTAFMSLMITAATLIFFFKNKVDKKMHKSIMVVFIATVLGVFIIWFGRNMGGQKDLLGNRISFYLPAIRAVIDYPLTGVGIGNFQLASSRYNDLILFWTNTAHNIFLEIFAEVGVVAGLSFLGFMTWAVVKAKKNLIFFLFLALFINFQFYYSYQICIVAMIFFILLGLIWEEKKPLEISRNYFSIAALTPLIYLQTIFFANVAIKNNDVYLAQKINPFNQNVYPWLIEKSIYEKDYDKALYYEKKYDRYFNVDMEKEDLLTEIDLRQGDKKQAIARLKKTFLWNPFEGDVRARLKKTYLLIKEVEGKKSSDRFVGDYLGKVDKMYKNTDAGEMINIYLQQFIDLDVN